MDNKPIVDLSKSKKAKKNPFFLGDMKSAGKDTFNNVVMPSIRRFTLDWIVNLVQSVIYGTAPGPGNKIAGTSNGSSGYSSIFKSSNNNTQSSFAAKPRNTSVLEFINYFDDSCLSSEDRKNPNITARSKAEDVLLYLQDQYRQYGCVSVLDFCEKTGQSCTPQANDWGWKNIDGVTVVRDGFGFRINLPEPVPLTKI